MSVLTTLLTCTALLVAGLIGITLSVSLQTPAVILLGLAAIFAAAQVVKCGSAGGWESKVKCQKVVNRGQREDDRRQKEGVGKSGSCMLGLSLIAIFYFVGRAWLSPVFDLGVEDLMLILSAGVLYLVAGYAVVGKAGINLRQGLAWVMIVLLLLHLGSCVMQLNGGEGYSLSLDITGAQRASVGHVTGMYGYYGSFANFAVMAGLLCLSLGVWGRLSVILRVLLFILGLAALGLAMWSQSRSAAISLIPALGVFGVLLLVSLAQHSARLRRRATMAVVSVGVLGLIAGGAAAAWVFQNRAHDEQVSGVDLLFDSGVRMSYWSMAAEQWMDYPFFGAGSRSFSYLSFEYWSPNLGTNEANPEFVHNEYLQLLADYGLIGLLLILGLLAWHFYAGGKQVHMLAEKVGEHGLKNGSNAMALTIAGMCGMTAMAVHICFDFRTHLQTNLLLFVCCAVWVLPVPRARKDHRRQTTDDRQRKVPLSLTGTAILAKGAALVGKSNEEVEGLKVEGRKSSRGRDWCRAGLALVLFCLGIGAVGLGGQQLWAGLPLLQNKMAKEDGAWIPQEVDRDVWIPMLEESLARAPQWRRYQRLGTLYRLEANASKDVNESSLQKAQDAYWASIDRHPFNPVSRINLAGVYANSGEWEKADAMYASAEKMSKAREWWFRLPILWSELHHHWAIELWQRGEHDEAKEHFDIALMNVQKSCNRNEAERKYVEILVGVIRLNDGLGLFTQSDELWSNAQQDLPVYVTDSLHSNIRREIGTHYLKKAKYLWHQRKTEEAYQALLLAKRSYHIHQVRLKGKADPLWRDGYDEVKEILAFFKTTGLAK